MYEGSGPDGSLSQEFVTLQLPTNVGEGFVVLLEDASSQAVSNWSDVVHFYNVQDANGGLTGFLDFISDPSDFVGVTNPFFLVEDASGAASYFSGGTQGANNDYFLHSDSEAPEPTAIALIGAALLSLLGIGVMRRRSDR